MCDLENRMNEEAIALIGLQRHKKIYKYSMDDEFSPEDIYLAHINGNALRISSHHLSDIWKCTSTYPL